jgi:hypothetical protein
MSKKTVRVRAFVYLITQLLLHGLYTVEWDEKMFVSNVEVRVSKEVLLSRHLQERPRVRSL